jgi:hypothetical protein
VKIRFLKSIAFPGEKELESWPLAICKQAPISNVKPPRS